MDKLPALDLEDFVSNSKSPRDRFVQTIGRAFQEIGFISLNNHFLSRSLIDSLYKEVNHFFNLPIEIKSKYEIKGLAGQIGYTSFGKEHAKGQTKGDLKEFWHFGQYIEENEKERFRYPDNLMVEELPDFNKVGKEAFKQLEKTGMYVLRSIALFLGLDEFYFDSFVQKGNSVLRPIYYPPIAKDPKGAVRAAEHGDINLITLLMGASSGGLQVLRRDGVWINAIPQEDELVVNVGDMLSRHSNDRLKSTIHRVVNPPREKWKEPRFSIPFFMHPIESMPLNSLDVCIDKDHPKKHEDIRAGEFLDQRLKEIGLKQIRETFEK